MELNRICVLTFEQQKDLFEYNLFIFHCRDCGLFLKHVIIDTLLQISDFGFTTLFIYYRDTQRNSIQNTQNNI